MDINSTEETTTRLLNTNLEAQNIQILAQEFLIYDIGKVIRKFAFVSGSIILIRSIFQ